MINEVIFSDKQGSGIIADSYSELQQAVSIHAEPIQLGDLVILPGTKTNLEGFFISPLIYLGLYASIWGLFLPSNSRAMLFYMGEHEGKHYAQLVYWITNNRFYLQYQDSGGRDYNKVKGVWCFNRPKKKKKSKMN
jgi:hypothetical protein